MFLFALSDISDITSDMISESCYVNNLQFYSLCIANVSRCIYFSHLFNKDRWWVSWDDHSLSFNWLVKNTVIKIIE